MRRAVPVASVTARQSLSSQSWPWAATRVFLPVEVVTLRGATAPASSPVQIGTHLQ